MTTLGLWLFGGAIFAMTIECMIAAAILCATGIWCLLF